MNKLFHLLLLTEENKVLDLDQSDLGLSHYCYVLAYVS